MKRLRRVLGIVLAIAVAATAGGGIGAGGALARPTAESSGYTCQYRRGGVTVVIDGPANSRGLCSVFNHSFAGFSTHSHPGRAYCGFKMRLLDVRLRAFSTSSLNGRVFCRVLKSSIGGDWKLLF